MHCDAHAKCTPNLVGYGLTSHHYPLHVICEKQAYCRVVPDFCIQLSSYLQRWSLLIYLWKHCGRKYFSWSQYFSTTHCQPLTRWWYQRCGWF